jgi:hypothetical protein
VCNRQHVLCVFNFYLEAYSELRLPTHSQTHQMVQRGKRRFALLLARCLTTTNQKKGKVTFFISSAAGSIGGKAQQQQQQQQQQQRLFLR